MLKKRILASSLASVMALSSVSVVAFADETASTKNEAITKAELKEEIKNLEAWAEKNLDDYGTTQADQFEAALERAKVVAADTKATNEDATAVYQMVIAVKDTMEKHTKEELVGLLADWKKERETENWIDEDIHDIGNWYTPASWEKFADAYDEAESYVEYATGRDLTELYVALYDAAEKLVPEKEVKKSDYRKALQAYQAVIAKLKDYQPWRRGKCTFKPTTGNAVDNEAKAIDITKATFVTFGDLNDIVYGASTKDLDTNGGVKAQDSGTYIAVDAGTYYGTTKVYDFAIAGSEQFDSFQKTNITTNPNIRAAYNAMVDAVNVFNGWVKDNIPESARNSTLKTLNKSYKARMYNEFGKFIKDIVEDAGGKFDSANGEDLFEWNAAKGVLKIKSNLSAADVTKAGTLALDSNNKIALDTDKKSYKTSGSTTLATVAGTKLAAGMDLTDYLPALTEEMLSANATLWKLYDLSLDYLAVDNGNFSGIAVTTTFGTYTVSKTGEVLDANETIVDDPDEATGNTKEWTILYQALRYAYEDQFPGETVTVSKKTPDVEALIKECNKLADDTGDCSMFEDWYNEIVEATSAAIEWVKEAKALAKKLGKDYTDGTTQVPYTDVYGFTGVKTAETIDGDNSGNGYNADEVYTALKKFYDALKGEWDKYPVSYGEVAAKIAEVADDIDDGVYGANSAKVKEAMQDVARRLSTLEASQAGNEVFTYDDIFNKFGRVYVNADDAAAAEIALYDAYVALGKVIEEAGSTTGTKGDLTGDNKVNVMDAVQLLKEIASGKEFTAEEIAVRDLTGDKNVNVLDAVEILKIAAKG